MSDTTIDVTRAAADVDNAQAEQSTKPTETVEFWKTKAREQEKRAKDNAGAARRLAEIEEAQKSEAQKAADRVAQADADVAAIPTKVAEALRGHLIALHGIDTEDAELFLTAAEPELLVKQAARLLGQTDKRSKKNHVPREGRNHTPAPDNEMRAFTRQLFGRGE